MKTSLSVTLLVLGVTLPAAAQDPVKVDSKHYQVVFEDAQVRVLRITYGPREKSVMHEHPVGYCVIMLTGGQTRFQTPDGKFTDSNVKAGDVNCTPAGPGTDKHNPENMRDTTFSAVLVERKSPPKP